jgi:hypothetical protein
MDLTQKKLTRSEWEFLEIPVGKQELKILKLIYNSRDNVDIKFNESKSFLEFIKMSGNLDALHSYCYHNYFKEVVDSMIKRFDLSIKIDVVKKLVRLKSADMIRIKNLNKKIKEKRNGLYEFILLNTAYLYLKSDDDKKMMHYYTLIRLLKNDILNINTFVLYFVNEVIKNDKGKDNFKKLIKNSYDYIERNNLLIKYCNVQLYEHQKRVFKTINNSKNKNANLLLYQAPTGTGKTLSPIGIKKKIIFVCAAKHIGLQLAKSCISLEIPIAIAFGCRDISDIRLHYFAAKSFTKHRRTGQIFRVDNSVGDKVEIIISDIQSYLYSMRYMMAFNELEDLCWYWDEPTITLDYENHEFHDILQKNWRENEIPNVILSSATLPSQKDIFPMIRQFKSKFSNCSIENIVSYECKKTIPILDSNGYVAMPHLIFNDFEDIKLSTNYLNSNKTILRHFDVNEMSKFILYCHKKKYLKERYQMTNYFENIEDINIISLKMYYLELLSKLKKDQYDKIYNKFLTKKEKKHNSIIKITTSDAHTLTDGPTILLTDNVEKIAKFYLKVSNIPQSEIDRILNIIEENSLYSSKLDEIIDLERQRQEKQKNREKKLDKDISEGGREEQELEFYKQRLSEATSRLKPVNLSEKYKPNSEKHKKAWGKEKINNAFTSDIDDTIVEQIMLLEVDNYWKILLMMGVGVFTKHNSIRYAEIMKKLAEKQKLYLIIASSDYIYGTNYQFCHGYISKDLCNMTQEKMIQALGRVGRRNPQMDYSVRIRDDSLIKKLLLEEHNKIEVTNMNKLFGLC